MKHNINAEYITKVNIHEFEVSEHLAHRQAFSKYVLCNHTCSSTLNIYKKKENPVLERHFTE